MSFVLTDSFSCAEAERILKAFYSIEGSVRSLPGEYDANFRVDVDSVPTFVLKVLAPDEGQDLLEVQHHVMLLLADALGEVQVPVPVAALDGKRIVSVRDLDGKDRLIHLLKYVAGDQWKNVSPRTPALRRAVGEVAADVVNALSDQDAPSLHRELKWNLPDALWMRNHVKNVRDEILREAVTGFLDRLETMVIPRLSRLPHSTIHNDINYQNLLVHSVQNGERKPSGLIDFGDIIFAPRVCEVAVAAAYAGLGLPDPLSAACDILKGFSDRIQLEPFEISTLYTWIGIRLCLLVVNTAVLRSENAENDHASESTLSAGQMLTKWSQLNPDEAEFRFREASGLSAVVSRESVIRWLKKNRNEMGPITRPDLRRVPVSVFDFSVSSLEWLPEDLAGGSDTVGRKIERRLEDDLTVAGLGRYNEARVAYTSAQFTSEGNVRREVRTVHLGVDVFLPAETKLYAPLSGKVHSLQDNADALDYGPTIIVEHSPDGCEPFYTLYGHLSRKSLMPLKAGQPIEKGQILGELGIPYENGGWSPHLHFQVILNMMGMAGNFPGVANPDQRGFWTSVCPDPNLILQIPSLEPAPQPPSREKLLDVRKRVLGPNLSVSYSTPLHIVRGFKAELYDAEGRSYLDCVNNVCHVGHAHPVVVQAIARQAAVLNTNTRYLHSNLLDYSDRLAGLFPDPLSQVYLTCSGSEATELALRMARAFTESHDTIVLDVGYHGNTQAAIEVSPYKHNGPGGQGPPPYIYTLPIPDPYRGVFRDEPEPGLTYALKMKEIVQQIVAKGKRPIFIAESIMSCGGQVVFPDGFLKEAYRLVKEAGGICIADEVQTGFGRVGSHFWAFQTEDVVPDIVTMGKPMGNGHPVAGVITTAEVAQSFHNGMEYFNTFGGNPVSCAAAGAVLDVIHNEGLMKRAKELGEIWLDTMRELQSKHQTIGDVRGHGLFLGLELVTDKESRDPAADRADYLVNRMKQKGILLSTDGPLHNVVKMKPPMVISRSQVEYVLAQMDSILEEDFCN